MGTFRISLPYLVLLASILTLNHVRAQSSLQVEFEQGFPLREDILGHKAPSKPIPFDDPSLEWRLPKHIQPLEYDLTITPVIDTGVEDTIGPQWAAPGNVVIKVNVTNATNQITLHSKNIEILNITVVDDMSGATIDVLSNSFVTEHSFMKIDLGASLEVSKQYQIRIHFNASISVELNGLYRSSYLDPISNTTKWLATTQMEAVNARQMFPCFDEPSFKAIFYITVGRRTEHVALSNMAMQRVESMTGHPGWVWERFAPTVKQSTYLLALIVSEFVFEQAPGNVLIGKTVRTYAPKHYIDRQGGVYAAEKAEQLLGFFQTYFSHVYPLSKMDSAAVPDFYFGAMENYGLNIYRESALLYFPDESTEAERFSITNILAHELAHQWFGNLVSPSWWTHIWLNEGFATYMAAQGVNNVAPEFEPQERFLNDAGQNSMTFDARSDYSHSVKIDEKDWVTKDPMDWFDRMAYEKAGSLIRMMNGFLTQPVMQAGLNKYLRAMEYNTAIQDTLFGYLNTEAKFNSKIPTDLTMKDIMDTWTLQPGFPILRVSVASTNSVYISQERFTNNEGVSTINQELGLWTIPMAIATKRQPNPTNTEWIYKDVAVKTHPVNSSEWIIVNADATGFYRVIYDASLTQLIKEQLELDHTVVSSVTRSQLLNDYFHAAWQKYENIETALSLASYLGNEEEIVVWNAVFTNLRRPFNILSSTGSFYGALREFLLPRIQQAVAKTGGVNATYPVKGGMPVIRHLQFLDWLCALEDPECAAHSLKLVSEWMNLPNTNTISRDIKPVVYCSAVANGNDAIFNFIKERYQQTGITVKQQTTLLNALACTKEVSLMNSLLEGILQPGYYLKTSDGATIMQRLAMNPLGRSQLLRFLRSNTDILIANQFTTAIVNVITTLSTYIGSESELQDVNVYLQENPSLAASSPEAAESIANALVAIQQNIQWVKEYAGNVRDFVSG